ncbi:MAG: BrnT family toxin [Acidobacteriaceae bacterium]|nr:BrnT family toxin [Acidobacteriaceae bacterium]
MKIAYSSAKDTINQRKHGISLQRAEDFDFDTALFDVDDREDYGEIRHIALGFIDTHLYALAFTQVSEVVIRAISLRKATPHERKRYAETY